MERRLKRFEDILLPKRCLKRVQYPDSLVGTDKERRFPGIL